MKRFLKTGSVLSFILSAVALIIGASFHGCRMNTENIDLYNLGVTMGIVMIALFALFLTMGIAFAVVYRKKFRK